MTLEEIINENTSIYRSLRVIVLIYWCIIPLPDKSQQSLYWTLTEDTWFYITHRDKIVEGPLRKMNWAPQKVQHDKYISLHH